MIETRKCAEGDADDSQQAYATAIRLLSRRDHSRAELRHKLSERGLSIDVIVEVLEQLDTAGYIDDDRYIDEFIRQCVTRGYGPLSIQSKLIQRGLERNQIQQGFNRLDPQDGCWVSLAVEALLKRFDKAELLQKTQKDKARMARFLESRGFVAHDALRALHQLLKQQQSVSNSAPKSANQI